MSNHNSRGAQILRSSTFFKYGRLHPSQQLHPPDRQPSCHPGGEQSVVLLRGGSDVVLQSERWEAYALEPDWPTHARVISKKTFCHESNGITLHSSLAWNTTSHVPGHNIQQILNRSYPQSNTATRTNRTSVYV